MKRRDVKDKARRRALKCLIAGSALVILYPFMELVKESAVAPEKKKLFIAQDKLQGGKFPLLVEDIWVVKKSNDYIAFENRCTHLGCPLKFENGIFVCQCHGSRFSITGKRLKGPAKKDLPKLRIKILGDGSLKIERTTA